MKKILTFLSVLVLATSCSSSDDSSTLASNKGYCDVTLHGETIHHEYDEGYSFSLGISSCTDNSEVRIQNVEQFEKSNYFLDVYFVHDETQQIFQGYDVNNSVLKPYLDIFNCYNNFDFIVEYTDSTNNDTTLPFSSTSNNFNHITDISVYSENQTEIIYAVRGNFEVTFKKPDNTLIPVVGSYKTFIYVLK